MPDTLDDLVNSIAGPTPDQKPAEPQNLNDLVNSIAGQPASQQQPAPAPQQPPQQPQQSDEPDLSKGPIIWQGNTPVQAPQEDADPNITAAAQAVNAMPKTGPRTAADAQASLEAMPGGQYAPIRAAYAGAAQGFGQLTSTVGRLLSFIDPSAKNAVDQYNRDKGTLEQGAVEADKNSSLPEWMLKNERAVVQGLTGQALVPIPHGAAALNTLDAMQTAATTAKDRGLSDAETAQYIAGEGIINGLQGELTSRVLGGLGGSTTTSVLKQQGTALAQAIGGQLGLGIASKLNSKLAGVDPNKSWSADDVEDTLRDAVVQGLMFHAAGTLNGKVQEALKEGPPPDPADLVKNDPETAQELAKKDQLSRSDMKDAGVDQRMNAAQRTRYLDQLKTELLNRPQQQGEEAVPKFITPDELSLQRYKSGQEYQNAVQKLKETGLSDADAEKYGDIFARANVKDRKPDATFGWEVARDDRADVRDAYIDKALEYTKNTGQPSHLVSLDFANMGGLNKKMKGEEPANAVLKEMAQAASSEFAKIPGAETRPMRTGGDEGDIVIAGASADQVAQATLAARKAVYDVAKKYGVEDIPHKSGEKSGDPRYNGVGIIFGSSEIKPGMTTDEVIRSAKLDRVANQVKGLEHNGLQSASTELGAGTPDRTSTGPAVGGNQSGETETQRPNSAASSEPSEPSGPTEPNGSGQQAAGSGPELQAGNEAVQPQQPQSVQPGQGNPAQAEHAAASETEGRPGAAPSESLRNSKTVTLYRGESREMPTDLVPGERTGKYFTTDFDTAKKFAEYGGGDVYKVEVPEQIAVKALKDAKVSGDAYDDEYLLPDEWKSKKELYAKGYIKPDPKFDGQGYWTVDKPPSSESLTREDLEALSAREVRKRLMDEFGVKSSGSKAKDIERYLKESGIVEMGSMFGAAGSPGEFSQLLQSFKSIPRDLKNVFMKGSLPNTDNFSRPAAEAMAQHIAANEYTKQKLIELMSNFESKSDPKLADDLNTALKNNRLMGVIDRHGANNDMVKAQFAADNTDIGPGKRFATEEDFKKFFYSPRIQEAIQKWKDTVVPFMNEQYRTTAGLDASDPVPTHGRYMDVPYNLLANSHAEEALGRPSSGASSGATNALRNYNPLRAKAEGGAQGGYVDSLQDALENTLNQTYGKATRIRMFQELEKAGAKILDPGDQKPTKINGEDVRSEPIKMPVKGGGMADKTLVVPESIHEELRQALNTDLRPKANVIGKVLSTVQRTGLVDGFTHVKNDFNAVINSLSGSRMRDLTIRGIPIVRQLKGVYDIASKAMDIMQDKPEIQTALTELARVNALRPEHEGGGPMSRAVGAVDKASRLVLKDFYDEGVKNGDFTKSETGLRDFVNDAVGDYNARSHGKVYQFLKDYGVSPFLTAGTTFAKSGIKAAIGSYGGAEATSTGKAVELRGVQLLRNAVMPIALSALATYALTGKGARPGVPLGAIDTGKDDEKGKPIYVDTMGLARRGLDATGASALISGLQRGQQTGLMKDAMERDIVNHNLHAIAGPAVQFASEAGLGRRLGVGLPPMPAADRAKGESQTGKNIVTALKDVNPMLGGAAEGATSNGTPEERMHEAVSKSLSGGQQLLKNLAGVKSGQTPMSASAELANSIYHQRVGDKQYTDDQQAAHDAKQQVIRDVRSGVSKDVAIKKAVDTGLVTEKEALASAKSGAVSPASSLFSKLTAEEAKHVIDSNLPYNGDEKADLQNEFQKKIGNLMKPLAQAIPVIASKKEEWKANVNSAIERAQKMGLTKEDVRKAYASHLNVKSDATRQADLQRFNTQLNARWQEQSQFAGR